MEFSGRLAAFPPAELLQWAHHERRTGSIVFRRSRRQKRVYFDKGRVVACASDDPSDYYGQHLLLNGHLNEGQLVDALSFCTRTGKRIGLALTELGLLSREQVERSLRRQMEDSVCGLFLWNHGIFYFEEDVPPKEEILPQPIDTLGLILEGTRWIDEAARFRRVFPHDNVTLRRGPAWPGENLTPVQRRIVAAVDGEKSLAKIHWHIKGSYFRVLEAAYHLCLQEVLDLGVIGEAIETTSLEINIYDLLLEQAMEEESQRQERNFVLPVSLIGGLRPVWVRTPSARDLKNVADDLRHLLQDFNGRLTLESLVPESRDESASWDFFLEHLRKGNLALLPASPAELDEEEAARPGFWKRLIKS
jgi:hypothetical protein